MGYLPFLSRRFLLEQKTPQSFPTEAVFPRCHSAFLYEKRTHPHTLDMRCHDNGCRFPFCPTMRLMESNRIRTFPRAPLLHQLSTLGQTLRSPFAAAVRAAVPLSATPCAGLRSRYSSPSPVYATIIHVICALVKPFLLFLYCFLAVLPIDFRHIVEGTCAERENVL